MNAVVQLAVVALSLSLGIAAPAIAKLSAPSELDRYDVVWTTPSKDAAGSMPLGDGEVGINLWCEENGDLLFYIGRTDALSEISRLLRVGRIRVSLSPNPFKANVPFRQKLHLRDGICEITAGKSSQEVVLRVFVDADRPVVHIVGESTSPVSVKATIECWRTARRAVPREEQDSAYTMQEAPFDLFESADVFPAVTGVAAAWYHRNEESVVPLTMKHQGLDAAVGTVQDPLLHRTFGGWMTAPGFRSPDGHSLQTLAPIKSFALRIAVPCAQTPTAEAWLDVARRVAADSADVHRAMRQTAAWWQSFWARSWVFIGGDTDTIVSPITRGYLLQRYVQACSGRGVYPIKFNGSIFTVEPKALGKPFNPDWRNWGDCYWWQNVRHMYHPMLANGDIEMMNPLFMMYEAVRPLCEARTAIYHSARGCYFPETMSVWGSYSNANYGWNRSGFAPKDILNRYIAFAMNQGPELVALMLDRWEYTDDEAFLKEHVLPIAEAVLVYFDTRYKKNSRGQVVLNPTQAVETYWTDVVNDTPTVAGLQNVCNRLCALPERITTVKQRAFFGRMKFACPAVPVEEEEHAGKKVRKIAPAETYVIETHNCENPELYALWPFRIYGLGKPGLGEAIAAYTHRKNHLDVGWGYDGNCAALLGLTDEAARILKQKCVNSHPAYRWPASWGPNFDWLPDQNHGGNLLSTTQLMLLQAEGDSIHLLPSWPRGWDVQFKLHAPHQTTVECVYRHGKIEMLRVTPESRRKDIVP
jgi:hypothetical protein